MMVERHVSLAGILQLVVVLVTIGIVYGKLRMAQSIIVEQLQIHMRDVRTMQDRYVRTEVNAEQQQVLSRRLTAIEWQIESVGQDIKEVREMVRRRQQPKNGGK